MLSALRSRGLAALLPRAPLQQQQLGFLRGASSTPEIELGFLNLQEVEKVLTDVKADDVRVIPVQNQCGWTDFMVIATGRSTWHVRNIAQALIHKVKQKQSGADRLRLPSVQGREGGQWIVIDSGNVIVHALHENARTYYNLESLWTTEMSDKGPEEDLAKAFVKIRPKNNSKKPSKTVQ